MIYNKEDYDLQKIPVIGSPRYKRGDMVKLVCDGAEKTGEIYVVDAFGTFEQNEEPSYDIHIEDERCLYKHICESDIIEKI